MNLNPEDQARIAEYYREALARFGHESPQSVHWTEKEGQLRRFRVLAAVARFEGKTLLDVGCGLGDLYDYLHDTNIKMAYTGIDIIPDFIELAHHRFPEEKFEIKDMFDVSDSFDIVLASGALSFKVHDNDSHYRDMIRKMYEVSKESLAFNMLDIHAHVDNDIYAAYDPNEIGDFCRTLSPHVEIITGYLPQDFTVYMYR